MNILIRTAAERETLFIALYKSVFPSVARYINKMGGSFDEAKDIFQDALVIYYEKTAASAVSVNSNEKVYLIGISKHLWLRKFKDNNHTTPIDGFDITIAADEDQPSESKLMHFLETAGKKCMELLRSFYYDQLPLADAAKLFGFSGVRSATVQKYKCLEKVRETIKERSLTYEDFLN
ncbi:RNA polymerase sigma factor [Mucilaginibacter sp. OK098]|uniref:RNA polymerase sigma factor n=1 Tax=Mucilaginibacter sp. OK098 TaxID=1855297 RepID=UPI00190ECC9F|nr:sigma-70 family RNA polymerase sigma factor [Mucilaginibacter sp. OK098]